MLPRGDVLRVGAMLMARAARRSDGRKPTALGLRVLAALVALLLLGSSLGQLTHFLVVQHAICAEHGELLEVHGGAEHADAVASDPDSGGDHAPAPAPDAENDHDHCQLLARQHRELGLPVAPPVAIAPAVATQLPSWFAVSQSPTMAQAPLALAPKTSPPGHAAFG